MVISLKLRFEEETRKGMSTKDTYRKILKEYYDTFHNGINDNLVNKIHKASTRIKTHRLVYNKHTDNASEIVSTKANFLCYERLAAKDAYKSLRTDYKGAKRTRDEYTKFMGKLVIYSVDEINGRKNRIYDNSEDLLNYINDIYISFYDFSAKPFTDAVSNYIDRLLVFMDLCGVIEGVLKTSEEIFTEFLPKQI